MAYLVYNYTHKTAVLYYSCNGHLHLYDLNVSDITQGSILLLTGPCGAGKTATVQVLAEEMSIEIQEWINPISEVYKADTSWQQTVYG